MTTDHGDAIRRRQAPLGQVGEIVQRTELRRARQGRVVAGVAAGLAARLNVDPTIVRIAFVVTALASSGLGLVAYLVLWAVVPEEDTLEDLLADRLESGEITADDYRRILADIEDSQRRLRRRRR